MFGGWFATGATVFSATKGIVHPYYLANIGPPIAGLVGAGIGSLRVDLARRHVRAALLPLALIATALGQWRLLARADWAAWQPWVRRLSVAALVASAILIVSLWVAARLRSARFVAGAARWVVGVQSAAQAEAIIIQHGEPVMSMGGFSGNDPILTEASLRSKIAAKEIRYFLLPSGGSGIGGFIARAPFGPSWAAVRPV